MYRSYDYMGELMWYDPSIKQWQIGHEFNMQLPFFNGFVVVNNYLVFSVGGDRDSKHIPSKVFMLDLSMKSPQWKPSVNLLTRRLSLGVAVINNCIYAVS